MFLLSRGCVCWPVQIQIWFPKNKVILDEAQAVKNSSTLQARAVKKLERHAAIALTGTPIENKLGDLWSLFDFLNPGLLGSSQLFKAFINGMEGDNPHHFAPLRKLVRPYILRRMKTDARIIDDLPEKTEVKDYCLLSQKQVELYQTRVEKTRYALEEVKGISRRGLVLNTIIHLKQICNHPVQFLGHGDYSTKTSGKFRRLQQICGELAQRQEKVLVFTQFREIINPIFEVLSKVFGEEGLVLHGGTSVGKRKDLVNQFQAPQGPPFFLLSLKAGGSGLNLTEASHVNHFDRWWNPAVENQATDRAFRIGQKKNVMVHKFIAKGTIEEKIDRMISEKKELAKNILGGEKQAKLTELSDEEIMNIISLDLSASLE
ncbi:MAG: DEAD/DEAH box helicase [Myxococcota bacterium]